MPVLRSREISSPTTPHHKSTPPPTTTVGQPPTPAKTAESLSPSLSPPSRRRSLRLNDAVFAANGNASVNFTQHDGTYSVNDSVRVMVRVSDALNVKLSGQTGRIKEEVVENGVSDVDNVKRLGESYAIKEEVVENGVLSLRSGSRVFKRVSIGGDEEDESKKKIRRLSVGDSVEGNEGLRSPKRFTTEEKGKGVLSSPRRYTREEKGKGVDYVLADENENVGIGDVDDDDDVNLELGLYLSREGLNVDVEPEQGVELGGEIDGGVSDMQRDDPGSSLKYMKDKHKHIARLNAHKYAHFSMDDDEALPRPQVNREGVLDGEGDEDEGEVPEGENSVPNVEDWPGPFSTAMKIIRDREKNLGKQSRETSSGGGMPLVSWTPRKERGPDWKRLRVPSLQSMCLKVLSENVDAIGSLNYVPDVLRHTLCQMLCDSRKMNAHFFSLLLQGSPSEVRVADCSWLEEEEFESSIKGCDTSKLTKFPREKPTNVGHFLFWSNSLVKGFFLLVGEVVYDYIMWNAGMMPDAWTLSETHTIVDALIPYEAYLVANVLSLKVLQLDLSGHCISDVSLRKAVLSKGLPVLTTISLKGACRVSDAGLNVIVSAAPVLRSLNLSQCSLLTDVGIKTIADSLGSIVHELYLDDCDTLNAMNILPSLQRLVQLEVLSLRGISSVSDKFIKSLLISNGQNIKELVLANCVNLTDSSMKVIAETCSQLCVLDLSYLRKLTDIGMAHLANGCHGIQDLRLCRNAFSDDAIAAFFETSGQSLKELSLNNVIKVGQNTTISLARRCKNLESLDLSWCRGLTDDALGLIADSCTSLRLLKIFGCTQITTTFIDGHSNPDLHVVGMKLTPILENIKRPDFQQGPLYYSAVPSF
ncbi:hypothetical protein KSS87_007367 [Heliosperma pusillum]|nr:hypothetical protein KSS87_007367 [Heliosperma pusillum]